MLSLVDATHQRAASHGGDLVNAVAVKDYPKKPCSRPHPLHPPPTSPPTSILPPFTTFQPQTRVLGRSSEWRLRLATGDQVVSRVSSRRGRTSLFRVRPLGAGGTVDLGMGHLYFWILDWPPWVQPAAKVGAGAPPPPLLHPPISPPPSTRAHRLTAPP